MFVNKKNLNRTLAIDSFFQTFTGRASHRSYGLALPLRAPETLSSSNKSRIFLYNAHFALFVWMDNTITCR